MLSGCLMGGALMMASCGGSQQPQDNNQKCDAGVCEKTMAAFVDTIDVKQTVNGVDTVYAGKITGLKCMHNSKGTKVAITNFGGRIQSIKIVDKNGVEQDVVLGFDSVKDYEHIPSDFGASIGRYANRLNQGKITIDGKEIQLDKNNFGHCLHGGFRGWQYMVYDFVEAECNDNTVTLQYNSPDGERNFPGNVVAKVKFTLDEDNAISIDYTATTDKETVINMTNHSYFNLNGDPDKDVTNCHLYVNADKFTPVDNTYMPTGELASVEGTPFDCRTMAEIGNRVNMQEQNEQIKFGNGYDHNWCLNTYKDGKGDVNTIAASLYSPLTGIQVDVYTNEPGIQCYSGNFLDGKVKGKGGKVYNMHAGFCLETQKYPNTPNVAEWPSAKLMPGETYHSYCKFAFSVKK
ncbi:MAG: galactose mutarotase [Bacteroidales bacterium]|nr:galactose mutarotase [Bacteroidales bacterium]